jgi:hypothetical protein
MRIPQLFLATLAPGANNEQFDGFPLRGEPILLNCSEKAVRIRGVIVLFVRDGA